MNERELAEKLKAGQQAAFGLLYQTYARQLLVVITRYVVEREKSKDLLHDCFIKIFDKISQFQYQGKGSLEAWLRRVCINECLMYLRKEKRFETVSIDDREDLQLQILEAEEPTEEEVERIPTEELGKMIQALPVGYRTVLTLFLVEGKSHKEIASMLGINEKSSSSQLARAKRQLAKAIKNWHKEIY